MVGEWEVVVEVFGMYFLGFIVWWMWWMIYLVKLLGVMWWLWVMIDWMFDLFFVCDISLVLLLVEDILWVIYLE